VREQRKLLAIKVDEGSEEELPVKAVPMHSIEELRPPSKQQEAAVKSGMGSGVGDNDKPIAAPYIEENLEMSTKESMEKVDALQEAVQSWRKEDMAGGGEAHGEVLSQLRALRDELGAEANHNEYASSSTKRKRNSAGASADGIPSKRGKGSKVAQAEVDDANIIGDGEKRGFTATRPGLEADDHGKRSGSGSGSGFGASGDVEAIDSGSGSGSGSGDGASGDVEAMHIDSGSGSGSGSGSEAIERARKKSCCCGQRRRSARCISSRWELE
jgi:hypothetical protein